MSVELCIEENCGGEIFCRNMCLKHYKKWYYSVKLTKGIKSEYHYKMATLGIPSMLYLKEPEGIRGGSGRTYDRETVLGNTIFGIYPPSYKNFSSNEKPQFVEKHFNETKENDNKTYIIETVGSYTNGQKRYRNFKDL